MTPLASRTPIRVGETADGRRLRLFEDGRLYVGVRLVLPIGTPPSRSFALFNAAPRLAAGEVPAAAALLPEVESACEAGEWVGLPSRLLLALCGKPPASAGAA